MKKRTLVFIFFAITKIGSSQLVSSNAELQIAIEDAQPGNVITLANGVWTDVVFEMLKYGTATNPIIITAETPGSVFLEGGSHIKIRGSYIVFTGFIFRNPSQLVTNGNEIKAVMRFGGCDDCIITNNKIDSYNGTNSQSKYVFKWLEVEGARNEISHNSFIGKKGIGSIINDNRNDNLADNTKIHHNYFANRSPVGEVNEFNDQDAIRIGNSRTSLSNSFTEVYENYFYDFFGEIEIISNKSGGNKYYNNTFRDYSGSLTLRHGSDCEVYGNFFFAENNLSSGGIRLTGGKDHEVYNNYIENVNSRKGDGSISNSTGGINISNGEPNSKLNGYHQIKNASITNNTFVNCDYAIRMGTKTNSSLSLAPSNVKVSNNIFLNTSTNAFQQTTKPINGSIVQANITQDGNWDLVTGSDLNVKVNSGLLEAGSDFHVLSLESPAINYGVGDFPFLEYDILGGVRPNSNFDAGGEEFGANGTRLPFKANDVGINVGFGSKIYDDSTEKLTTSTNELSFSKAPDVNTFNINSNIAWEITNNSPWINVSLISGEGSKTISVSVLENTSGFDRVADLIISQVGGGTLTQTVSIIQTAIVEIVEITPVSVSGQETQAPNNPENVLDEDDETRWTGNSSEREAFLTFDLGCEQLITGVNIKFFKGNERTSSFKILVSNDNISYEDISGTLTSSGNTIDYERFNFPSPFLNAKYFRIQGLGNSSSAPNNVFNSYVEVRILGNPINCDLSIEDNAINSVKIYPIPVTQGKLMIKGSRAFIKTISVYSITGKLITNTSNTNTSNNIELDLSAYNSGFYFLKINNTVVQKIIID